MSRSNPYKWMLYFLLPFQLWRLVTRPTCNIISNGFCFAFRRSYIFISDQKIKAKSNRVAHRITSFMRQISAITSPTNWYLYRWVNWNISEVTNENSTSAFNYLDDFRCGFLWQVGSAGGNVNGSLIISGASSRLSACLGNALWMRGGPLPFLSVFLHLLHAL